MIAVLLRIGGTAVDAEARAVSIGCLLSFVLLVVWVSLPPGLSRAHRPINALTELEMAPE